MLCHLALVATSPSLSTLYYNRYLALLFGVSSTPFIIDNAEEVCESGWTGESGKGTLLWQKSTKYT